MSKQTKTNKAITSKSKHHDKTPAYLTRKYTPADVIEIDRLTRNIINLTEQATADELTAGADWYRAALKAARALGKRYNVTTETAAAVIAAVSPRAHWDINLIIAEQVLQHHRGQRDEQDIRVGQPGFRPIKHALSIINGTATLTGPKRRDFMQSIITAGKTNAVCVDGHAVNAAQNGTHRVGISQAKALTDKQYQLTAQAYATAAHALGYHPATLQAVVWVTYRNIIINKPTSNTN